ncbi:MAG TPA: hypothetical protein VFM05_15625 [Candidatus Saccharimonadales bacterium]|nr:hypothetical protein [Candidatus Saccharimonadales bacterium]
MQQEIIISSSESLKTLVHEIGLFKTASKDIRVQFDHLSDKDNSNLQQQVMKHYKACGCSQGRTIGIITLLGFVALVITGVVSVRELGIAKTLLFYFLISFITMLIGKIVGLWQARQQLTKLATQVENKPLSNFD